MTITARCLLFAIVTCLLLPGLLAAQGAEPDRAFAPEFSIKDTHSQISGVVKSEKGKIRFSVDYSYIDEITVTYSLNGKEIVLDVSQGRGRLISLRGENRETGATVRMTKQDRRLLGEVLYAFQLNIYEMRSVEDSVNSRALDMLVRATELLSKFDVGREMSVEIEVPRMVLKSWTSLCDAIGQWRTAYWTNYVQSRYQSFVVGGHGVCKGRCGAGCPWFADPAYTQDCLNHDACAGEEGQQLGPCGDEWDAAADDFLFAPDCT